MEVLIQSQLQCNSKLEVPESLKDLMADISREVLRAQPENLYSFISDYLSALLVTREHLTIACRLCRDAAETVTLPTLVEELKTAGVQEEDAQKAANIIFKYVEDGEVKEEKLINELIKETAVESSHLPAVQSVIQKAFMQQKQKEILINANSSKKADDDVSRAVDYTLKVYEQTKPSEQQYIAMATRIQAAYKGYGVRRHKPKDAYSGAVSGSAVETDDTENVVLDIGNYNDQGPVKQKVRSLSSHTLAGSWMDLPKYKPYCVNEPYSPIEESERTAFDYTATDHDGDCNDDNEAKVIFYNPNNGTPEEETQTEVTVKDDHHVIYVEEAGYADNEFDDEMEKTTRSEKVVLKKSHSFLV